MKTFVVCNERWRELANKFFFAYLPQDLDVTIHRLDIDSERFQDEGFLKLCSQRIQLLHDAIQGMPDDELLLFLDVDMTFFQPDDIPFTTYLTTALADNEMGTQAEFNGDHNIGVWLIRCSPKVKQWFATNLSAIVSAKSDQEMINQLLKKSDIKVINFDRNVINGVHLGVNISHQTRLMHATCAKTLADKVRLLTIYRDIWQ